MAFPSTISTLVSTFQGVGGPFLSSGGNVYVLTRGSTTNQLHMFKATDPSSSWSGAGTDPTMTSGGTIRAVAAYQVSDNIHVITRDAQAANDNELRYHVFSMASDTWTTTNELVHSAYTTASAVDDSTVTIVVRSNGDVIVSYEGPQVLADINRSRTYYARRLAGTWSADIALDNGGNAHWFPQETILGSGDRVHFIIMDLTGADLYQRTITSANVAESFPASFDNTVIAQNDVGFQRGVAYSASAGGTVVRYPYYNSFNPDVNDVRFTSADAPTPLTVTTDITNPTVVTGNIRRIMSLAADGNTVYNTFIDTNLDIYNQSSQDAAAWSAPSLFYTGSATSVWSNIYVRNSARVIGMAFVENDLKYTEYTLSSSVVPAPMLTLALLGVGR